MRKNSMVNNIKEFIILNWEYYAQFLNDDKETWIKHIYYNMYSHSNIRRFLIKNEWDIEYMTKYITNVIDNKEEIKKQLPFFKEE